jgi:CBS domain-containing protein
MHIDTLLTTRGLGAGVLPTRAGHEQPLRPDDPALKAVTDFSREQPASVDPDRSIDDALQDMIRAGVRALLVVREQRILGLITSYDIQGEKPMQFLDNSTYTTHGELRVSHIMTPWEQLPAADWRALQTSRAGELLQTMERAGVTHLLVIDTDVTQGAATVRALVSRARLARQLQGMRSAAPTMSAV